jgi:hypothetical protein
MPSKFSRLSKHNGEESKAGNKEKIESKDEGVYEAL